MLPPQDLIDDMKDAGLASGEVFSSAHPPAEIPNAPGAYILLIGLTQPVAVTAKPFPGVTFQPGWYIYTGSANGPGGMRARVARHLRHDKRAHWHVDHLTREAKVTAVCFSGADECRLMDTLIAAAGFTVPVPGFGSTDCQRCDSHLARWTPV